MPTDILPTAILPNLPRSKTDLDPLEHSTLLRLIAQLKELYIPPIHGGFQASDVGRDDTTQVKRRSIARERRFSASLVDTMDSLGLGLNLDVDTTPNSTTSRPIAIRRAIIEENPTDLRSTSPSDDDAEADESEEEEEEDAEQGTGHLDPFEREWAEKWLNGVVRRAQGWIEEHDEPEDEQDIRTMKNMEAILRDSTAVLAMMAGTSAAGSLTRHLLFPIHDSLSHGLKTLQRNIPLDPSLSPTTTSFLASLSTSPVSPIIPHRLVPQSPQESTSRNHPGTSPERRHRRRRSTLQSNGDLPSSPETVITSSSSRAVRKRKRASVPILLHDAPMQDHISVGVQTWGSAILLGREMSLNPSAFGLFPGPSTPTHRGVRVLELGAGTGLLGILCRKLLDLRMASRDVAQPKYPGLVVATDFHHDVLSNLKVCVDLNFPPHVPVQNGSEVLVEATNGHVESGVKIAKLDWTTFPQYMQARQEGRIEFEEDNAEIGKWVGESFDLVLASDCVYDPTHAKLLREVAGWVLRLPDENDPRDIGGTYHLLSPIRPTFTPELESIDLYFPTLASYSTLSDRQAALGSEHLADNLRGEGLGLKRGLKLGVRGEGKRSVKGRKGEGRIDEVAGYWWWEVGWG